MADPKPQPDHPGERLANYFNTFFATIVGVSTFGASVTFSKVLSQPVTPWIDYGFSTDTIQSFLAISWLLFMLDLGITSFVASALSLYRPAAVRYFGTNDSEDRRTVMWYATIVSFLLFGTVMTAFLFLGLAVTGYVGPIGWAAVSFIGVFAALGFVVIVWQSPIGNKRIGDIGSAGYQSKENMDGLDGRRLPKDDSFDVGTPEKGGYSDADYARDRLPWVADPVVPTYTADLRRLRSTRNSDGSRYMVNDMQHQRGDWANISDMRTYNNTPI